MVVSSHNAWSSSPSPVGDCPVALSSCRGGRGAERLWGVPRDRGARGEGAVGGGWQPSHRWAGSSQGHQAAKGAKTSCMEGGTSWWLCSSKVWRSVEMLDAGNRRKAATPSADMPFEEYERCPGIKWLCWGMGHQGRLSQSQKHLATGPVPCFCTPGAAMQWGGGVIEKGKKLMEKRGEEVGGVLRDEHASHPGGFH